MFSPNSNSNSIHNFDQHIISLKDIQDFKNKKQFNNPYIELENKKTKLVLKKEFCCFFKDDSKYKKTVQICHFQNSIKDALEKNDQGEVLVKKLGLNLLNVFLKYYLNLLGFLYYDKKTMKILLIGSLELKKLLQKNLGFKKTLYFRKPNGESSLMILQKTKLLENVEMKAFK